jgi:sugar O-acyltransferase (sialic acid O-acetyltransferase NeuD family)
MNTDFPDLTPLHVVGAGGLGKETLDALFARGRSPKGLVLVDDHSPMTELHGVPVRRPEDITEGWFVTAVADPELRSRLSARMVRHGLIPTVVVHPRATLAHDVTPGAGSIVLANAFVSTGVHLGSHVQVQYNTTIGHDTRLGDYVTVLPGANVAGNTTLCQGVTVGSNACVLQGLEVGTGTFVGAGAVVTKRHPDGCVLTGVPARQHCTA